MRRKSQITIPKVIIVKLGLSEGDKLDIFERDGTICMLPVVVYPKKHLDEFYSELDEVKAKIASGFLAVICQNGYFIMPAVLCLLRTLFSVKAY